MASYKIRTAGNCLLSFLLSGLRSILESDAGTRCRYDCCSQAILRSFNDCCRRNYSSLQLRKLESDADHLSRNGRCRRAIPHYCDDGAAVIRKSGPKIKNRCTKEGVNEEILALIRKFGPEIKNRCTQQVIPSTRSLDESLWR